MIGFVAAYFFDFFNQCIQAAAYYQQQGVRPLFVDDAPGVQHDADAFNGRNPCAEKDHRFFRRNAQFLAQCRFFFRSRRIKAVFCINALGDHMNPASVHAGLLYQTICDLLADGNIIVALGKDFMAPAFLPVKYLNGICQYQRGGFMLPLGRFDDPHRKAGNPQNVKGIGVLMSRIQAQDAFQPAEGRMQAHHVHAV